MKKAPRKKKNEVKGYQVFVNHRHPCVGEEIISFYPSELSVFQKSESAFESGFTLQQLCQGMTSVS